MTKEQLEHLIDLYHQGKATREQRELIDQFYEEHQWRVQNLESGGESDRAAIGAEIFRRIQAQKVGRTSAYGLPFWMVAATVFVMIGLGWYLLQFQHSSNPTPTAFVTKSTLPGQKITVTLGDGTVIRLNSESTVTYPEIFKPGERNVRLVGEAFFEVTKDPDRPFIVESGMVQTTVLGTSFNINAFDTSNVAVALVTGKVQLNTLNEGIDSEVTLRPGELAVYEPANGGFTIDNYDPKRWLAWKENTIYLSSASYVQVFDRLSRWYGVDIEFINHPHESWDYSGEFKNMSLELVLETIGFTEGFVFQIHDDKVMIRFKD